MEEIKKPIRRTTLDPEDIEIRNKKNAVRRKLYDNIEVDNSNRKPIRRTTLDPEDIEIRNKKNAARRKLYNNNEDIER